MIAIEHTYISDDVADQFFVCDLQKCKGACCVEGDSGAPLEESELPILEEIYERVKPYLSPAGIRAVEAQGKYVKDKDGDWGTPTVGNRECAYAVYQANGVLQCGIERAYLDGKTAFKKPLSCHLYPIRITHYDQYDAVNYDRWQVCSPACAHGARLGVPLYQFLKEPLIRKYGEAWYAELVRQIGEKGI
ncbi:MAG: DUF3109 family protein [Ferruginibacter sp.]|nr:DUF3109 family protein [Cytophagales bacterium]